MILILNYRTSSKSTARLSSMIIGMVIDDPDFRPRGALMEDSYSEVARRPLGFYVVFSCRVRLFFVFKD